MNPEETKLGEFDIPDETKEFSLPETTTYGKTVNVCPVCGLNNYRQGTSCVLDHGMRQEHIKVILAEDSETVNKFVTRMIQQISKVNVVSVHNGQELFDALHKERFYFIFSDISMPEMNGPDALIKAKKVIGDTPIMLLTACDLETIAMHEKRMMEARLNLVYTQRKPFKPEEIKSVVARFFRGASER